MKKILSALILLLTYGHITSAQDVGLIVNEFSNGPSGTTEEYIELLVVGCPSTTTLLAGSLDTRDTSKVDLRGWIVDDNNGDFSDGASTGEGIAQGHIRFASIPAWENIPVGALIIIYDGQNPPTNTSFPSDDFTDANGDLVYVLPLDADDTPGAGGTYFFDYNADFPTSSNASYTGGSYTTPPVNAWTVLGLRNGGDAVQTREPVTTDFFHGVAYGDLSGTTATSLPVGEQGVKVTGGGSGQVIYLSNGVDGDYRDVANYTAATAPANETPGALNNLPNSNLINNFRTPSFAGDDRVVCSLTTPLAANGVAATWSTNDMWTFVPTGQWTVEECPVGVSPCDATNVSFTFPTSPTSQVTVTGVGTYKFRWTQNTGDCQDADEVFITFVATPTAAATDNLTFCGFSGNLDAVPFPNPPATSLGKWTVVDVPPASTTSPVFADDTDPNTLVTVDVEGDYEFRWTIGQSGCSDDVTITATFIQTPIATVGSDQEICGLSTTLTGNTGFSGQWTATPSAGVSFTDDTQGNTQVTVTTAGTYTFTWTVGTTGCEVSDMLDVQFTEQPTVDADINTDPNELEVCGTSTTLAGSSIAAGTDGVWSSSSPNVTFSSTDISNPTITISDPPGFGSATYTLTWTNTVTAVPSCNDADNVEVTFYEPPTADADILHDPNQMAVCGTTVNLQANAPATGVTGMWTVSPSAGVTFSDATSPTSTATISDASGFNNVSYTFTWTLTVTAFPTCQDASDVVVDFYEPPTSDAGMDEEFCNTLTANLSGNTIMGNVGEWSVVSSPTGSNATLDGGTTSASPTPVVLVDVEGSYTFRWTLSNGPDTLNCDASDDIVIEFIDPEATVDASQVTKQCDNVVMLLGNVPESGQTGMWTVSPSAGVTFSPNANTANATATVPATGSTYAFTWTISEGTTPCTDDATVNIEFFDSPVPDAGPDANSICGPNPYTYTLQGNTPPSASITGNWSYVSGPDNTPTFSNSSSPTSDVTVDVAGTYVFRWSFTLMDGGVVVCVVDNDVTVEFTNLPTIDAGDDQLDICGASLPTNTTLDASVTPNTAGTWSVVNSPMGSIVNFVDNTDPNTGVSLNMVGTYVLRWTAGAALNATCEVSDEVTIVVTSALVATIPNNPSPICGLTTSLEGSNTPLPLVTTGQWTASPSTNVVFSDPTNFQTDVTVPVGGDYTFTWTVGQGLCQSPASITVNFSDPIINARAEDIEIFQGNEGQLEVLFDAPVPPNPTYAWTPTTGLSNPNIGNPIANPDETTTYTVTINSGSSCQEVIDVTVTVIVDLRIPNVFTPNGDGVNDTWLINQLDQFPNSLVKVYNRWGSLVFESKGYITPWDGTYNGKKVPTGTYYYVVDAKRGGNPEPMKGAVTVTY